MLLPRGLVAAVLLLSGVQARVPRVRLAARDVDTTPEPATTTTRFPLPFESTTTPATSSDVFTSSVTSAESTQSTTEDESTTTEVESTTTGSIETTDASTTTDAFTTPDAATATDASTTEVSVTVTTDTSAAADVTTTTTANVPTTTADAPTTTADAPTTTTAKATTETGFFAVVPAAATSASSSFTDLAAAASSIAANPSPSAEEVEQFQQRAQEEEEQLQQIQSQLQQVDRNSLSDHDSHTVEAALVGLAALLGWFSTQLTALAPAVITPALAPAVFATLAPAFGAAAAGTLLAEALEGLDELDDNDDDDDDNNSTTDDDNNSTTEVESTKTEESSTVSTTASETSTTSEAFCSAIPYELNLPSDDDDDNSSDDMRRWSIDSPAQLHERGHIEKRARTPFFGDCKAFAPPLFPANPSAQQMVTAEDKPSKQTADWLTNILRWYDRKDCSGTDLTPGWAVINTADAKIKGATGMSKYWTVDHVWELKFFTDFFEFDLVPGTRSNGAAVLTCDEFDLIFMTKWGACGNPNKDKKLKTVMEQLVEKAPSSAPKSTQLEFVVMQKQINEIKGAMFKVGELAATGFTDNFSGSTLQTIQVLAAIGNAVDIFNSGPVKALFEVTNQRMYNSFRGIDQFVTDKAIPISGGAFSFADKYQTFMDDRLNGDAAAAWTFVQTWMAQVDADITAMDPADADKQTLVDLFDAFRASDYANAGHYSFSANRDLAGTGGDVIGFKRSIEGRDEGDGDSCPIPTTTEEASSTTDQSTAGESTATTEQTTTEESTAVTTTAESTATSDQTTTGESTATASTETTETTSTGESTATSDESTAATSTEQSTATTETTTNESTATSSTEETSTAQSTATTDAITPIISTATTFSTTIISRSTSEESSVTTVSTESEESTSSTRTLPNIRTVTSDGMICTLIEGSLNPVCRPISVPTANPAGTNIHVNKGCILIGNSPRCASDAGSISSVYESSYNVASDPNEPYSTILILSGFDASIDNQLHSKATCQLQARWPANYGDVYYGEDGCLYDSQNNKIFDQCCSPPDINNSGPATNPYVPPAPPNSDQYRGNHDGSSICASISKDTCLSAASRYVDDVVYHQYTSAVWPDASGEDIANAIFPIAGPIIEDFFGINYGCTVIWTCDNDDAFSQGMTGKQIKDSMLNIYNLNGAKGCGSTYLYNGCHVTVNGCNNCRDAGHAQTLWNPIDVYHGAFDDANDGFPPRR
ncbi:hypothetical protein G7Z17_g7743 [Cylindrodendrum hubeiense]|uniref:Uncharacterized protein n=1 Tax=Cylindrodendrum hubeiense TaxID=595255 RepID=A0A9P5H6L0_9HYPO|nr:hypothetical protein G7Z17_g7743 [Cylindrodendrum hubeiense]